MARRVEVRRAALAKNAELAARNRALFQAKGIKAINLLSAPGAGKTTLLEKTIRHLHEQGFRAAVIVGDLATENDAERLRRAGAPAVQIATGTVCHLDAAMVAGALEKLDQELELDGLDFLFIENVGNLVCPASYDLGEDLRVVLFSTPEGEDKPLKYPPMFKSAQLVIINKIDVAEVLGFDLERARENVRAIAPQAELLELSARTGEGLEGWYAYLEQQLQSQPRS